MQYIAGILLLLVGFVKKFAMSFASTSLMIAINVTLLALFVSSVYMLVDFSYSLYREFFRLVAFVNSFGGAGSGNYGGYSGDSNLVYAFKVLRASGIWNGAVDAFAILIPLFVTFFTILFSIYMLKSLMQVRKSLLMVIVASK